MSFLNRAAVRTPRPAAISTAAGESEKFRQNPDLSVFFVVVKRNDAVKVPGRFSFDEKVIPAAEREAGVGVERIVADPCELLVFASSGVVRLGQAVESELGDDKVIAVEGKLSAPRENFLRTVTAASMPLALFKFH